jgi:hypothetical protein
VLFLADYLGSKLISVTAITASGPAPGNAKDATKAGAALYRIAPLRNGALVCDVSRPFNVVPEVFPRRPDLKLVSGGLIKAPSSALDTSRSATG